MNAMMNFDDIDEAKRVIGRELRRRFPEVETWQFDVQTDYHEDDRYLNQKLQAVFPRRRFDDHEREPDYQLWINWNDGPLSEIVERITNHYSFADEQLLLMREHVCPKCNSANPFDDTDLDKFECCVCGEVKIKEPPEPMSDTKLEKECLVGYLQQLLDKLLIPGGRTLLQEAFRSGDFKTDADDETANGYAYRLIAALKQQSRELRKISDRTLVKALNVITGS
jgi:hypothetical protein